MHGPTEFDDVSRFTIAEKIRSAAFVACISDYCRAQMMRLVEPSDWDKLAVVRCGLDSDGSRLGPTLAAQDGGPLRVLTIGRLVPDKGQMLLLRGACRTARQRRAGDPDHDRRWTGPRGAGARRPAPAPRRLRGVHRLAGPAGGRRAFERADVFCLPSFAEGLPVVLMEAMSHCLPVVATRIAGVAELVEDGVSTARSSRRARSICSRTLWRGWPTIRISGGGGDRRGAPR